MGSIVISIPLLLALLVIMVALPFGFMRLSAYLRNRRDIAEQTNHISEMLTQQVQALTSELQHWRVKLDSADAVPRYLDGLIRVCEAQTAIYEKTAEASDRMADAVKVFTSAVVAPDQFAPSPDEVRQYDESLASRRYLEAQFLAEGLTEDEAQAKAEAVDQKKILYPQMTPGL